MKINLEEERAAAQEFYFFLYNIYMFFVPAKGKRNQPLLL